MGVIAHLFGKKNPDTIADFLNCLGSLENKNSQLFEELSNRTTVSEVKRHLIKISQGNENQSKILLSLGTQMGSPKVNGKQCRRKLQSVCKVTETVFEQVKKKKKISAQQLSDFLSTLEHSGGAMQFLHIQVETFLFMAKEISKMYKMDMESFNKHIMEIAQQVEEHIELLEEVKEKIAELTTEKKDKVQHPVVKYQNPDAWYPPTVKTQV